ncbi:GNAT family N-acetyltransferase [Aeoliella mucimassa]|nr:N-acetyltransferase [Aeoliella mucimassa]
MSVTYIKRHRMEVDLRRRPPLAPRLPKDYRLVPWCPALLEDHAEAKYLSFHCEMDAELFPCLGNPEGCRKLMQDISAGRGFIAEATWLIASYDQRGGWEPCATIQGSRYDATYGAIQNVGVVPQHRHRGLGAALVSAALLGFQQVGLPQVYLEVTSQNVGAARLYQRLGFKRTKTIYKTVEMALS